MDNIKKSNALTIIFAIFLMILFLFDPNFYMQSTLKGLIVWLNSVLPSLFPFFIFTKILTNSINNNGKFTRFMDKLSYRCFGIKNNCGYIYFLSIISGYPVGAKLLGEYHKANLISTDDCTRALSFCSTSGPIFLIGAVGVGILGNYSAGIILCISHILGSFLNGVFFNITTKKNKEVDNNNYAFNSTKLNISDIMYNSIISILLVGGFIAITFVIIDMFVNVGIISAISGAICKITGIDQSCISAVLCGLGEMTRGCLEISKCSVSLGLKTIICSGLIAFSGISIFLQTLCFVPKEISRKKIVLQKITQAIFTMLVCWLLVLIFNLL